MSANAQSEEARIWLTGGIKIHGSLQ